MVYGEEIMDTAASNDAAAEAIDDAEASNDDAVNDNNLAQSNINIVVPQYPLTNSDDSPSTAPTPARLRSRPGTGKGGKRYNVGRNQLKKKAKSTTEEKKSQKEKWKKYVGMVQEETEQILSGQPTI